MCESENREKKVKLIISVCERERKREREEFLMSHSWPLFLYFSLSNIVDNRYTKVIFKIRR